ncbi:PilZ domain-containing protein [Pseudocolwellia sp. HL-MZ19]|uniref:PilZ domain-containing protein n=1 Tax=unclassified Pseudocolwellia TaxID=2848178 RepID=UPI003CF7BB13
MSDEQIDLKLKQFDEFFSITHQFNINVQPLVDGKSIPYNDFVNDMPTPFKLANDIDILDQEALAPLGAISGIAGQLVQYLNYQAKKIDLLVDHILSEQDNKAFRFQGITFGGGGIEFISDTALCLNDVIELKIFLTHINCAIYCHSEIISVDEKSLQVTDGIDAASNEKQYHHKVIFRHIREDDRERLVRSSLHLQSKQLQQLAKERHKQSNQ